MAKYGSKARQKVKKAMHERKSGTLKTGKSGKTVRSRKQAIAIGLSEARRAGAKVPAPKKTASTKTSGTRKKASSKTSATKKSTTKKSTTKRKKSTGTAKKATDTATAQRRASVTRTAGAKSSPASVK